MKSKKFILKQIQDIIDNRGEDGSKYIENIKDKTVVDLLVLKRKLAAEKVDAPVLDSTHQWLRGTFRFEE
tara:strand:- start:1183 stop:1392 length:210 start_codon:yes stop_codon:yes gene_type:complete